MPQNQHVHPSDIRGLGRLAVAATLGLTDLVETVHANVAPMSSMLGSPMQVATRGIARLVYQSIRGVTRALGDGVDAALGSLVPQLGAPASSPEREAMLAALNGVVGDYLDASNNPLALRMGLRRDGHALELTARGIATAIPEPRANILLMVHGLCMNDLQWQRNGHDHGARLAAELGYTQVYLRYNTGLHISANGRAFADLIEALLGQWPMPVEKLVIVGHSMGGLVARSACHYGALAGHAWLRHLDKLMFLGTPHHGAALERVGNWVNGLLDASPYTAAFARLGKIRSAGITDLRYGNLLDSDWADADRFAQAGDRRRPVPLPGGVRCYAFAATTGKTAEGRRDQLVGDGLVSLSSALGAHTDPSRAVPFPEAQQSIGYGMNHLDLLDRLEVYRQIVQWARE